VSVAGGGRRGKDDKGWGCGESFAEEADDGLKAGKATVKVGGVFGRGRFFGNGLQTIISRLQNLEI